MSVDMIVQRNTAAMMRMGPYRSTEDMVLRDLYACGFILGTVTQIRDIWSSLTGSVYLESQAMRQ